MSHCLIAQYLHYTRSDVIALCSHNITTQYQYVRCCGDHNAFTVRYRSSHNYLLAVRFSAPQPAALGYPKQEVISKRGVYADDFLALSIIALPSSNVTTCSNVSQYSNVRQYSNVGYNSNISQYSNAIQNPNVCHVVILTIFQCQPSDVSQYSNGSHILLLASIPMLAKIPM